MRLNMRLRKPGGAGFDEAARSRIESHLRRLAENELSRTLPPARAREVAHALNVQLLPGRQGLKVTAPGHGGNGWLFEVRRRARPFAAQLVRALPGRN